jgi:FkbM family methyltransferase
VNRSIQRLLRKSRKLGVILSHADYRAALRAGHVAAAIEHTPVLKALKCATVVDIGANRGQFALVARHVLPNARIISFEPLAAAAAAYRAALGANSQIMLHPVAVGDESGDATLHVSALDDSSSLLPITERQTALFAGTQQTGAETIRVAKLDELVLAEEVVAPALLKIDVQGYELKTLRGCDSLLDRFNYIYVECSFIELYRGQALADDVIAHLRNRSFALCGVYNASYDIAGQAIQADFLFTRQPPAPPGV